MADFRTRERAAARMRAYLAIHDAQVEPERREWCAIGYEAAPLTMSDLRALAAVVEPPGYERVAEYIANALTAADVEVSVFQDGEPARLLTLARCLDKAGLIDWAAFAEVAE